MLHMPAEKARANGMNLLRLFQGKDVKVQERNRGLKQDSIPLTPFLFNLT